jgi:hypothetical protein
MRVKKRHRGPVPKQKVLCSAGLTGAGISCSSRSSTSSSMTAGATASGTDGAVAFDVGALLAGSSRPCEGASSLGCSCGSSERVGGREGGEGARESVCCFLDWGDGEIGSPGAEAAAEIGDEDEATGADDDA